MEALPEVTEDTGKDTADVCFDETYVVFMADLIYRYRIFDGCVCANHHLQLHHKLSMLDFRELLTWLPEAPLCNLT